MAFSLNKEQIFGVGKNYKTSQEKSEYLIHKI